MLGTLKKENVRETDRERESRGMEGNLALMKWPGKLKLKHYYLSIHLIHTLIM